MRLIGKLLALPFVLVMGILYLVCKFLVVISGAVLGILSGIVFLAALVLFFIAGFWPGLSWLVVAFLLSPYGLPMAAAWLVGMIGGVNGTDTLHFATCAKQLGAGLYEQLARFVSEHRDTRLIIIDTLQKIREASGDRYSYASDYEIIGQLKHFADQTGIALLLVHHTRKQQADDKFDMISGTNGLLGAADGAFVLQKEKRTGNTAVLEVSGRDQPEQRLILKKDMKRLIWELEKAETELWQIPPDPILEKVAALLSEDILEWSGTPTELAEALKLELKPNLLTKHLNVNASRLFHECHTQYENIRTHAGRRIILKRLSEQRDDA